MVSSSSAMSTMLFSVRPLEGSVDEKLASLSSGIFDSRIVYTDAKTSTIEIGSGYKCGIAM